MSDSEFEAEQEKEAAAEAAAIGGRASSEPPTEYEQGLSEADRPVIEAGEGESEGFELAEKDLEDIAEHGDEHRFPDGLSQPEEPQDPDEYGEPDEAIPPDENE
jgi:hypothetical protein